MARTRLAAAPAEAVVAALRDRSQTLATAESLTGGLVGATLTAVPGASAVYRGGLIVYATELKAELARVSPQTLAADGPVAASTAAQLARGAADVCGADWGLATTGVAGPEPQDGHPVGQVFVAVAGPPSDESRPRSWRAAGAGPGRCPGAGAVAGGGPVGHPRPDHPGGAPAAARPAPGRASRRSLGAVRRRDLRDTLPNARSAPTLSERLGTVSACDLLPR